jgi:membrane protein implicated in regulation of membrane protease activity
MTDWGWWILAAVLLGAGELHTGGFYLAPFAIGALAGVVAGLAGAGGVIQLVAFFLASAVVFGALRPIARRHITMPGQLRTGTAALVGGDAIVVERVDSRSGCVRIGGEVWSARTYLEDEAFEPGAKVHVMEISGATALVSE